MTTTPVRPAPARRAKRAALLLDSAALDRCGDSSVERDGVGPRPRHFAGEPSSPFERRARRARRRRIDWSSRQPPQGDGGPREPSPERVTATGEPAWRGRGPTPSRSARRLREAVELLGAAERFDTVGGARVRGEEATL